VYESDSANGPWMKTSESSEVGTLFITNSKRYVKFDLKIASELSDQDVENYGFVLLVEVAIANPIPSVLSRTAKKILSRFPSWTKMFEDSIDSATPELQQPSTTAGSFINALVSDFPENFEKQVNQFELDRFITTADENQIAWIYTSSDVPASHLSIKGDAVTLSRVDTLNDFYESTENDYCYYYAAADRRLFTKKLFKTLIIDTDVFSQEPLLKWNWFDEFGARVGLRRLYLEQNTNFKKRILDTYKNLPGPSIEAVKRTLRRELDIWSAYGATPDSNYLGATPEILEISDIESSTPYFDFSGKPNKEFRDFVRSLNEKYPLNWGYVKWGEGYWDYSGKDQAGIGRIPAVYDDATPLGKYYQPGVGDISDANIIVKEPSDSIIDFNEKFKVHGSRYLGQVNDYAPIFVEYDYYGTYTQDYYENNAATVNIRYILEMPVHGSYTSAKSFYTDITYYPVNSYGPGHSASPEYEVIPIFDQDGYANASYIFKDLSNNSAYLDTSIVPNNSRINYYFANKASATPMSGSDNFNVSFTGATPHSSTVGSPVDLLNSRFTNGGANIKVSSNKYTKKRGTFQTTPKLNGYFFLNDQNEISFTNNYILDKNFIHETLIFPPGATPIYIHIDNVKPSGYEQYDNVYIDPAYDGYGGLSVDGSIVRIVPASPNIFAQYINPNFATPHLHEYVYIPDGEGLPSSAPSTVNYYFVELKYPYGSTPSVIQFKSNSTSTSVYPFKRDNWEYFTAESTPMINGSINKRGIIRTTEENYDDNFTLNSNFVGSYDLTYDTFGLDYNTDWIEKIEVSNETDGVTLTPSQQFVTLALEEAVFENSSILEFEQGKLSTVEVTAEFEGIYSSYLNVGWYHQNGENYYIYALPVNENFATPGFYLELSHVSRQGAPVIIERNSATPKILREVAFFDEASPTYVSLVNKEIVKANRSNDLYLGYEDIYDIEVIDSVTGYTLMENGYTQTNAIKVFDAATPGVYGRDYYVTYKVKDSYAVDNDVFNESSEKYVTSIRFDSTPSSFYSYDVTYEKSIVSHATPISLNVDPMEMWDQEGFIYLSHTDYSFDDAVVKLNPPHVIDDINDFMVLTINSLDENGNSKPYQTFQVSSSNLFFEQNQNYVTTDINGFASILAYYDGDIPATSTHGYITISGVTNGSINAHSNSQTQGFVSSITFEIYSQYELGYKLKAIVENPVISADGLSNNYIRGFLKFDSEPQKGKVIYWRKGRTLQDIFDATPYSSYVLSDDYGNFEIGPFTAQNKNNPGFWIVAVETEGAATVNTTPTATAGDIVFWGEKYDNLNYAYGDSVFYNPNLLYVNRTDMYSTPLFTVQYFDGNYATPYSATPDWLPPKWYPINRYDQYMMGLLGSTPMYVNTYNKLMKDYEEE
jgi:hypothetical protein